MRLPPAASRSFAVDQVVNGGILTLVNRTEFDALGADIRVVANGSLGGFQVGASIGEGDLAGEVIDPTTATAASYTRYDTDDIGVRSGDGKAASVGRVAWYHGGFPFGYRHRGELYDPPVVTATSPVGCIWAQVEWGYPLAGITFPPAASIAGAEEVGKFFVNCRWDGNTYPAVVKLGGLSYAKAMLNSMTFTVCTSATKADGPRYCGASHRTGREYCRARCRLHVVDLALRAGLLVLLVAAATVAGLWRRRTDGRTRAEAGDAVLPAATLRAPLGPRATLVQFSSEFCAPCRAAHRVLAATAAAVPGVAHVEVDAAERADLVRRFEVRRTPTLLVLGPGGRVVGRAAGVPTRDGVRAALTEAGVR